MTAPKNLSLLGKSPIKKALSSPASSMTPLVAQNCDQNTHSSLDTSDVDGNGDAIAGLATSENTDNITGFPSWYWHVGPSSDQVSAQADQYFNHTARIVSSRDQRRGGSPPCTVRYAIFLRRPVRCVVEPACRWLDEVYPNVRVIRRYQEGAEVGAGDPLLLVEGAFADLANKETALLQIIGAACVACDNAYAMCIALPATRFVAMEARHCCSVDMNALMTYAAAVAGSVARKNHQALGFVGNSVQALSPIFSPSINAYGSMPHALVGYAGSTVAAAEMFVQEFPQQPLTVLIDYFGQEITDALAVCQRFPDLAHSGSMSVRIDTNGSRYMEGLDPALSYAVLERHVPYAVRHYLNAQERTSLIGTGVSAASVWYLREKLDNAGYTKVKIVASGGFDPSKCQVFSLAKAPVDTIGTGNFLPQSWSETYATADVIAYDGKPMVKAGREYLLALNECFD